ncbi:hypothetical protein CAPTEDRAFT_208380 [Capitella teleta]|uniref:Uncharacterized protein n=1 Tax=Capitella teleta TaxID=283909 RepID=R7TTM9_CAPTE|nr:hypothetical protein CAPTEDRAFT_208380 [Capitella teleta]|eukprot:ELT94796.1 hypothetical protein CAPTEDRAFT_208380 [Capitella teleta]
MDTTRPVYVINSPSATENAEDPFRMRVRRHNNTVIHSRGPSWCCFCFTGGRRSLIRGLLLLFIIAMLLVIFGSDSGKRVADNPGIGKIPDEKRVANIQAPIHISSAGDTKWDGGREEYDEPTYRDTINDFDPNDDYGVTSDASVTQLPGMVDGDTDDNIRVADTHYREKLEQIRQQEEEDLPEFNADWFLANDKSTQTVDHATVRIATTNIVPSTEESLVVTESPSNLALNYAVQEDLTSHKQGSADPSELYEEAQRGNLVQSFTQEGGSINPIHLDSLTTEKPQDITQESPESPVHESQALLSVPAVGPAPGIASSLSVPEQMNPIAPQSTASEAQSQQVDTLIVNVSLPNASRNVARPLGYPQREILINSSLPQDSQSLSENVENISDENNSINQEEVQFAPVDSIRSKDQNSPNVQVSVEHTKQNVISPAQSPAFIVPGTEIALGIKPYVPASRNEQSVIPEEITQDTLPPPVALNETSNTEASFGTDNAMNQLPVASNAFGEVPNIDPNSSIGEPNTVNQLPVASNALEGLPNIDPNSSLGEPNTVNQLPVASNALEGSPNIDPNSSIREPNTVNQLPVASNALDRSSNIDPNSSIREPNTVNQLPVASNALEGSSNIDPNSSFGEPNTVNQLPVASNAFEGSPNIDQNSSIREPNTVNQLPVASNALEGSPNIDPNSSIREPNTVNQLPVASNALEGSPNIDPNSSIGKPNTVNQLPVASNALEGSPNIDPNSSIREPNTVNQLPVASNALEGSSNIDPNSSFREPNTVNQLPVASNALEGSPNIDPNSSIREPNTVNQLPVASNALEGSPNIDPNSSIREPNTVNQLPVAFNALEGSPNIDPNSSLGEPNTVNQLPVAFNALEGSPNIDSNSSLGEPNTANQLPAAPSTFGVVPKIDPSSSAAETNTVNQIPSASDGLRELPSPDPKYSLQEQNQVQNKESDLILSNEFNESTAPNNILGMSNSVGREPIVPDDAYLVSGVDMNYASADSEDSTNKAYLPHVTKTPSDYTFESLHSLIPDFNMPSVTLPPRTYEGAPPAEMFKNIQSQLEGLKNIHSQIDDASQRLKDLMAAHHSKIMGHLNDEDKGENIRDYSGVTHSLHQQDMTGYAASNTGTLIEEDTSKDVVTSVTEDPSDVTQATKFDLETNDGPTFVEMNQSRIEEKIASGEGLSEEALRKMEEIQENKKEALLIEEEEPRDVEIDNNEALDQTMAVKVTGGKGTDSISEYFIDNDLSNNDHKKQEVISDVAKKETKIEPPKDDDKEKSGGESDDLIADSKEEENNSKNENERKKQEAIQDVAKEETKIEPQKEESRGESDDPIAESKKEKDSKKKNEQQEGKKKSENKDEEPKEKPDAKTEKNDKAELELLPQKKIVVKEDMTDEESEFNFFRSTEQVHVACDNYGDLWTRKPVAKPFCLSYDFTIKAPCTVFFASSGEDRSFEKIASKLHECSVTTCYRFGKSKESCDVDSFMKKLIEEENGVDYLRLDLGYDLWSFLRSSYLNDSLSNVKQLGLSLRTTNAPYNKVGTTEPTKEELFHYYQDLKYLEDLGFLKWYSHDERRYLNISRHYPDTYISTGYDLAYINRNFARGSNLKIDKQPSAALSELLSVIEKDDYECKNNLMKKHRDDMDWDVCLDKDLVTKNDCHVFIIDAHDNGRSHWTMADALRNNFGCEEHVYLLSSKTDAAGYIPNDEPIYPGYNVKYLRLKGQRLKSGDVHVKDMQLEDVIRKTKVPGVDILKIYIPLSEPKIMENIVEMDAFDDIKQIILNLEINESQATTIPSDKDYELFIEMLSSLRDMGIEQWRHTTTTRVNSISTGMTTTVYQLNFVNTNAF